MVKLASGSADRTRKVWDVDTGMAVATLTGQTDFVESVSWLSDALGWTSGSSR